MSVLSGVTQYVSDGVFVEQTGEIYDIVCQTIQGLTAYNKWLKWICAVTNNSKLLTFLSHSLYQAMAWAISY